MRIRSQNVSLFILVSGMRNATMDAQINFVVAEVVETDVVMKDIKRIGIAANLKTLKVKCANANPHLLLDQAISFD